jgi:hypothetical protein
MSIRVGDGPPEPVEIEVRKGGITLVQVVRTGRTMRIRQVVLGGATPAGPAGEKQADNR